MIAGATYVRREGVDDDNWLGLDRVILVERRQTGERQRDVTHWLVTRDGFSRFVTHLAPKEHGVVDHVERVTSYIFEWVFLGEYDDKREWFTYEEDELSEILDESYDQQRATTLEVALSTLD